MPNMPEVLGEKDYFVFKAANMDSRFRGNDRDF